MKRIVGWMLAGLLGFVVIAGLLLAVYGYVSVRRSFPQVQGEIRVPGLVEAVEVVRGPYGIPHIYAANQHDLFFAEGYVHAQDRFYQMDFWRHIGSGRLSEMFGEGQLETDLFLRTLGWERLAQQELEALDEPTRTILEAYSQGVNAYLVDHQGRDLSLEYAVLGLINSEYQPEPWNPVHTLTWAKVMAWDLSDQMEEEIERAILLKTLSVEQVAELFPPYPDEHPLIVAPDQPAAVQRDRTVPASPALPDDPQVLAALQQARTNLALAPAGLGNDGLGSNSWVISGDRTESGKPLLANDPHLGVQLPSIWYEIGLHCQPVSDECPFEVAGFSFAGAPGVVIGHNQRIAWGFTNVGPDVQDLFVEKINPDNPFQYEYNGQWVDMEVITETIQVSGGDPTSLPVRITRHGPVVSDTFGDLEAFSQQAGGMEFPQPYAVALKWTALQPQFTFRAILGFDQAQNWDEFRLAARDLGVPAQNLVYADVDGNIGYQMPGLIPIRAAGDARLPLPGWSGAGEWQDFVPFEELPFSFNPPQGYLATANNAVVSQDYAHYITSAWDYGYRAERIVAMIESAAGPIGIEAIQQMQGDDLNGAAFQMLPYLLELSHDGEGAERLEQGLDLLQAWDLQNRQESAGAALFGAFWRNLVALTFHDDLPEGYWPDGGSRWFWVVNNLLNQPASPWWDDRSTAAVEDRDAILRQALLAAMNELESLGKNPAQWTWGKLHTVTFRNQSLGKSGVAPVEALLNRGPFPASGGSSIVNATGWDASLSDAALAYEVRSLPSMRMIVDLSDLENSLAVNTLGQSGHAFHPHYQDMVDMWRTIQYHPFYWERASLERQAEGILNLVP